jgi:hypothetical protein
LAARPRRRMAPAKLACVAVGPARKDPKVGSSPGGKSTGLALLSVSSTRCKSGAGLEDALEDAAHTILDCSLYATMPNVQAVQGAALVNSYCTVIAQNGRCRSLTAPSTRGPRGGGMASFGRALCFYGPGSLSRPSNGPSWPPSEAGRQPRAACTCGGPHSALCRVPAIFLASTSSRQRR